MTIWRPLVAALCVCLAASSASAQLTIHFFDVGQGDAAFIRAPNGKTVLIDAGPSPTAVAAQLKKLRVDAIDLVIASHNHADHIGGMPAVLASFPVRNYMDNGMPATTRIYSRIVTLLEDHRIPVLLATRRRIDLGDGVVIRILGGTPDARTQNDASIGVELSYGSFRVLFTGDAEPRQRAFWLNDSLRHVGILKVSHHGSINGTDSSIVRVLHPCAAVVSVGARNAFGHPSPMVLELLQTAHVTALRTDLSGTVDVTADSTGVFSMRTARRNSPATFDRSCAVIAP